MRLPERASLFKTVEPPNVQNSWRAGREVEGPPQMSGVVDGPRNGIPPAIKSRHKTGRVQMVCTKLENHALVGHNFRV